jgi:hypothetical protein
MPTPKQLRRYRAAHAFADRGWFVQPLVPGTSRPMSCELCWTESPKYVPHRGFADCPHPADFCHSFYSATCDHDLIESWFRRFRNQLAGRQDWERFHCESQHHCGMCCSSCWDEYQDGNGIMVDGWCCCRAVRQSAAGPCGGLSKS